jgi:cation transport ATPase
VNDDSENERGRFADEAGRRAREAEARARAKAERIAGEMREEELRQSGVIYGGLIAVAVVMVQGFLEASSLDASGRVGTIAFAVAIPLLAALVMINRQEAFRGRRTTSVSVTLTQAIAQLAAFVGFVAAFWDITWVAGVTFLVAGIVAVGVHSAGFWRVESPCPPATTA